jgi:hypothetical protein
MRRLRGLCEDWSIWSLELHCHPAQSRSLEMHPCAHELEHHNRAILKENDSCALLTSDILLPVYKVY